MLGTVRYAFATIIEHQGRTMRKGHYVAHVDSSGFKCCNDEVITDTTWENVETRQAYLLVYVRANA